MGYTYYRNLIVIPEGHPITLADLLLPLTQKFNRQDWITVEFKTETQLAIHHADGWELRVSLENAPFAALENQEIAKRFVRDEQDRAIVASSTSYLSTAADPDPQMRYFDEYVSLLEVLEQYPDLYILDPNNGEMRKT